MTSPPLPLPPPPLLLLLVVVLVVGGAVAPCCGADPRAANRLPPAAGATEARSWLRACYLSRTVPLDKVDPFLCTHLLVFFGHIDAGSVSVSDSDRAILARLVRMRDAQNPALRVCLTVGAVNDAFAASAATDESRARFSASVVQLLNDTDLDGVDLDWEFPAYLRPQEERRHFTLMMERLGADLRALPRPRLLSAAVAAPSTIVAVSYEAARLAAAVDFLSVMTYDFHFYQALTPATGHNAPLYATARDRGFLATLNTNYSAHVWLGLGVPPEKLLLGIPTYGHCWTLRDQAVHGVYAPASGACGSAGYMTLPDVCRLLAAGGALGWDAFSLAPYAFRDTDWVSFETARSVAAKAGHIRSLDIAGAMTFSMDNDDWEGVCGEGSLPLHRLVRDMLPTLED